MPKRKTTTSTVYHLGPEQADETLASALRAIHGSCSWGQAKKWISGRQVQVNGNLCLDEARRVREGDVVKLHDRPLAKPVSQTDIRIEYLDEHLLVVQKPAGVTSVRHFQERKISVRRKQLQPTLEELLPPVLARMQHLRWPPLPPKGMNRGKRHLTQAQQRNKQRIQNAKKLPPELQVLAVHRLDRDTSGLMLFARTRVAEQRLLSMFKRHTVRREYMAVCSGEVEPQTRRSLLVRDRGDGIRGSLSEKPDDDQEATVQAEAHQTDSAAAQKAVTQIVSAEAIAGGAYSIVRCRLETGRTHQLRIHLSELGHPICGDKIYHRLASGEQLPDTSAAPRQALHSDRLEFTHPVTGEHMRFDMPLPRDLHTWLEQLNSGSDPV